MSDFVQTMKDWRRMCKTHDACSSCPMGNDGKSCMAVYKDEFEAVDLAHIEQTVAAWAKEHPEPVYPSWREWLAEQGILVCNNAYPNARYWYEMNKERIEQPIPDDIAKKLGIEPKEGT